MRLLPQLLYHLGQGYLPFAPRRELRAEIDRFEVEDSERYLRASIDHARNHVPYYRELLSKTGDNLRCLEAFPPLTKAIIREQGERLHSDDLAKRKVRRNSSGGSTGQPVSIVQDQDFGAWRVATEAFYFERFLKIRYNRTPNVVLWGSERDLFRQRNLPAKVWAFLTQSNMVNSFRMTPEDMLRAVALIDRKQPEFLKGYAGSLYELSRFIRARGLKIHRPRVIYSAAETLRPFMRTEIEETFGCKVFDYYGSREVGAIAGECRRGKMHVFSFNNLVEVVDDQQRPVDRGEEGQLLITTLHNDAMPLIRYTIGDTAVLGDGCDCGSELPTLQRITGRVTDHFLTKDGNLVHGEYFTHLFYFQDWVSEFQVLQTDYDRVEIYYVPREQPSEAAYAAIEDKIKIVMGDDCRVSWHEVKEVPRTPQGKLLFTRSLVHSPSGREEVSRS